MDKTRRCSQRRSHLIRAAIIFANYGPYHVARALALLRAGQIDTTFVELAASEGKYPWHEGKAALGERLLTLHPGRFEECTPAALARDLVMQLARNNFDAIAVAGYSVPAMRAAVRWARRNGKPVVMMSESTMADNPRSWARERLKRWWMERNVDAALVGGARSREYMQHLGVPHDRIWDRYDVVDNELFTRTAEAIQRDAAGERARRGLPERYFLYVGRFATEKNLHRLLEAYRAYSQSVSDPWAVVMVGSGPLEAELKSVAGSQGLRIIWPGAKKIPELAAYYALASCFVLPSTSEPWGLVVNEAMACGLPVLASSACGCAPDLVREGVNGYTFDPRDVSKIAAMLQQVSSLSAAHLREMSGESRRIITGYTPDDWARNLAAAIACSCRERMPESREMTVA